MSETAIERPSEFQGLMELAKRQGWRRLKDTKRDGSYLSERTVFRDTVTGCLIWRMTCDPAVDKNDYYDIPGWNADGSLIGFLTRRTGNTARWLMDSDGSNLRPMPTSDGRHISTGYWSIVYPDRFYHAIKDNRGTHVVATNPYTGERQAIVSVNRDLGSMMPPHPSEEWFLFGDRKDKEQTGAASTIYVVDLDGSVQEIGLEKRWHRLRFTKSPDRRIFFNFDNPRTQWSILPDGTDRTSIPDPGNHPDWLPDGSELTYYNSGSVWAIRYDGTQKRRVIELESGGHGGPCLDGEWFVSDTPARGKYPNSIIYFRTDGSEICHVISKHVSSFYSHSVTWHPDHHSSHPHPNGSPDGTKSIFNGELLGQYTDIYVGINRFPDPPRDLSARIEGTNVILTWKAPVRCQETRGYHVYRSDESGINYQRLSTEPVTETEWRSAVGERPGYYLLTAVEYSGLESGPSNEAFERGNGNWEGAARLAIEAESGKTVLPMREFIDQVTASNGYYVACLDEEAAGSLTLSAAIPKASRYYFWARVKGDGVLSVECDGEVWGSVQCLGDEWTWQKVGTPMELSSDRHELKIRPTTGSERIDKVLLIDDSTFTPVGLMSLDNTPLEMPTALEAVPLSPNVIKLSWSAGESEASDLDHFNVYCGETEEFACHQAILIGSPTETEFIDWGLTLNTSYRYKVTAVDRAGNESSPSKAAQASTPLFEPIRIELKPQNAKLRSMVITKNHLAGSEVLRPASQDGSMATWEFKLLRDGECALWGRSIHKEGERSTFDLIIDDKQKIPWTVWGRLDEWLWSPAGNMVTGTPQLFQLGAGKHKLQVQPRTLTSQVAEIVITDDPTWMPVVGMRE